MKGIGEGRERRVEMRGSREVGERG